MRLAVIAALFMASAASAEEGGALASATYAADPDLRCDLLEVKRASGGALNIRWRLTNMTGKAGGLTGGEGRAISYDFSWKQLYFIDPAESTKYEFLVDADGERIAEVYYGSIGAGDRRENWAKFPAPPATSTSITVQIPWFPPFDDIPVGN